MSNTFVELLANASESNLTIRDLLNKKREKENESREIVPIEVPKHLELNEGKLVWKNEDPKELTERNLISALVYDMFNDLNEAKRTLNFSLRNKQVITEIANIYFNETRGVFLFGNNSSGKSFMMDRFCRVINKASVLNYVSKYGRFKEPVKINKMLAIRYTHIFDSVQSDGKLDCIRIKENELMENDADIYIDDLGYNRNYFVNAYGTKVNLVEKMIELCYSVFKRGNKVFINSNLDFDFILKNFGKGVHDRLSEMCYPKYYEIIGEGFRVN